MIKHSRLPSILPRLLCCVTALALACAVALAQEPQAEWQRVGSESPPFSLEMPGDWSLRGVEARGARLVPPDGGPVVEVVAWNALRPPATADKAAIEHEGVLARVVDYRRDGIQQITTDEGAPALVVTGRVRWNGETESSVFCAYSEGATHYVLGTFAAPDELSELRERVLDRMMRSFRADPGAAPAARPPRPLPEPAPLEPDSDLEPDPPDAPEPEPEQPAEPEEPATPPAPPAPEEPAIGEVGASDAPGSLQVGGELEPVGPEIREPRTPWVEHLSPSGFSISIPMDWEVETAEGVISLTPAIDDAGDGVVLIWPVIGSDPGAEAALRLALTRLPDLRLTRITSVEQTDGATRVEGAVSGGRRLVATWAHDGAFGLLRAVAADEADWDDALGKLARMAASFRPGDWPVAYRPTTEATGEAGLLRWEAPVGWEVTGGAVDEGGELSISIEATAPSEDAFGVGWHQPMRPCFRSLTPLLESLGWREGERYSAPEGGEGLTIYRRREPEKLVREMLLPRHSTDLNLTAIDAGPTDASVAALLPQEGASGQTVTVKGASPIGPRERLYLAATAAAAPPLSTTCWDAAYLRADAPEGRLATATEALVTMVRTAQVAPAADDAQGGRLEALIEGARRALSSLPDPARRAPATGLASVLDGQTPQSATATWAAPAGAGEYWSEQAADEDAVNTSNTPVGTRPGN